MNLLESYDKYGNQLKESFIKKTSSRNTDEVIKQADESFDTDFLFEKTCFLLKAICKGKKDIIISFRMPYYKNEEGKITDSYYLYFKDCSISLNSIKYNPSVPDNMFLYCIYKNAYGGGYCSSDIVDQYGKHPYCREPDGRYSEYWKYSDPRNVPKDIQLKIYKMFETTFEEINTGDVPNLDLSNFSHFRKPDPDRMTKLLRYALRNYPNKGICNFFAEKYSHLLQK